MAETHAQYMARRAAELSKGKSTYGGGAVQQSAPTATFQPAITPQNQSPIGGGTGPLNIQSAGGNTPSGGGAYDAAAAQAAQKAAEEEARRAALKGGINKLISDTMGIYDGLFGNVAAAAKSQLGVLNERYDKETGSLTDQFNTELPKIGRAYAGRGAYDSSYRLRGEADATKGFTNQMEDIGTQYKSDQAKIGQFQAEEEARMNAERAKLERSRIYVDETTSIDDLVSMRNELNNRISELETSKGSLMSQQAYRQKAQALAPATERLGALTQQLSTLINGQAPGPLKRQVAMEIIGSAGLAKQDEDTLLAQVNAAIG